MTATNLRVFTEGGRTFRAASTGTCIFRNWLRSPCSLYSMTTHRGCSTEHTPNTLAMFWSSRPAKILTSFCNSALVGNDSKNVGINRSDHVSVCFTYRSFSDNAGEKNFTATSRFPRVLVELYSLIPSASAT